MNRLFNTDFELSLRMLLLLRTSGDMSCSVDKLLALDFITIYGRNFGISTDSLNGENEFCFSELAYRRELMKIATNELVLKNLVNVHVTDDGFEYSINERGNDLCNSLDSDYARDYSEYAERVIVQYGKMNEHDLMQEIGNKSTSMLKRK